jgi:hypothetical protein
MSRKLTSRKFWALLIAVIGAAMNFAWFTQNSMEAFGVIPQTAESITAVVAAIGACVAYIFGEGAVDSEQVKNNNGGATEALKVGGFNDNN